LPNRGGGRQRGRSLAAIPQGPGRCCHGPEPSLGRTESPKGSPQRVLETERVISELVHLGSRRTRWPLALIHWGINLKCLACFHQWTRTQCLSCTRWSPHSDWYAD